MAHRAPHITPSWRQKRDQALSALKREKKRAARLAAAQAIWELSLDRSRDSSEFGPAMLQLLTDGQDDVRRMGLKLAKVVLQADELEPLLVARISDPSAVVRVEAVGMLADLESPSLRPTLTAALSDSAFAVRFEAARGLAALHHRAGLEVLVEALEHDETRFRALGAVALLADPAALPAVRRIYHRWLLPAFDRDQAAGAMAKLGDIEGSAHLLKRTHSRWALDRAFAIELCGEVKAPGAFEELMNILANRSDRCRGAAARGLGRLGNVLALEPLVGVLEDRAASVELRLDAAQGLCLLGVPEGRSRVEQLAQSAEWSEHAELREILEP